MTDTIEVPAAELHEVEEWRKQHAPKKPEPAPVVAIVVETPAPETPPPLPTETDATGDYPRWVKVHPSWIVKSEKTQKEMHDSGHWNHIVDQQANARPHVTASPEWPEFHVHATGIVDVKVHDAEQEAKATSPKNPT